jgi:hypothetical protein
MYQKRVRMSQLKRRLCPVKIYLIMETFCSTNHRKISIVVIWGEVNLSNIWKQRKWSLTHYHSNLITRGSRGQTILQLRSDTMKGSVLAWHLQNKSAKYALVQVSDSHVLSYLHAQSFKYWIFVYNVVTEIVFESMMIDLINLIKPTYNSSCVCVRVIGFRPYQDVSS